MRDEAVQPDTKSRDDEFGRAYAQERLIVDAAELISQLMEERGLSRADLARLLGYRSRAAVTRILSGRTNLTLRSLGEILHVLGAVPILDVKREAPADATRQPVTWIARQVREQFLDKNCAAICSPQECVANLEAEPIAS